MPDDSILPAPTPHLLTVTEVAQRLGVSAKLVHSLIAKGKLTVIYSAGKSRLHISMDELLKFIQRYGSPPYDL